MQGNRMSYTVLARKYRPQSFGEVIGQEHVTRTLKNAIAQGRIAQGYIFSGHRGIGKTTVARILAMALNCRSAPQAVAEPCGVCDSCVEIREGRSVDVIEIDAATNRGIDEIRELREAARYRPARDRYKIYILDEAHQITDAAFNALLKTLEEPPGHVVFMMATTAPEDIPQTIRSRCQHFSFHAVLFDEIMSQLRSIAGREEIAATDDALSVLAEAGDGSMRDALSIMDQAIACCGQSLEGETVRQLIGAVPSDTLEQIMGAVQRNSSQEVLRLADNLIREGQNPTHFTRQLVRFLRNALVAKVAGSASPLLQISSDERARAGRVADLFSEEDLARFFQILLRTHADVGYKQEQRFHLELGLLKMVHAQRLLPVEQLLSGAAPPPAPEPKAPPAASAPGRATPGPLRRSAPEPPPAGLANSVLRGFSSPSSSGLLHTAPPADFSSTGSPASPGSPPSPTLACWGGSPGGSAAAAAPAPQSPGAVLPVADSELPAVVIAAAEGAGYNDLANLLRHGQWNFSGTEAVVEVADPPVLVQLALGKNEKEAVGVLDAALSGALARPARLKIVSGAVAAAASPPARPQNGAGVNRAAEEPVIRRLQEKFGAEIRSIVDYREKD
jgi:DNA polymerase-3 subunit gamma/tau